MCFYFTVALMSQYKHTWTASNVNFVMRFCFCLLAIGFGCFFVASQMWVGLGLACLTVIGSSVDVYEYTGR